MNPWRISTSAAVGDACLEHFEHVLSKSIWSYSQSLNGYCSNGGVKKVKGQVEHKL